MNRNKNNGKENNLTTHSEIKDRAKKSILLLNLWRRLAHTHPHPNMNIKTGSNTEIVILIKFKLCVEIYNKMKKKNGEKYDEKTSNDGKNHHERKVLLYCCCYCVSQ